MIDEFAVSLQNVIEDTSVETCLQMTATVLDTVDFASAAGKIADRYAESEVAAMDAARDRYIKSYSARKNVVARGIRATEKAITDLHKVGQLTIR